MTVEKRSFVHFDVQEDSNGMSYVYNWRIEADHVAAFLELPESTMISRIVDDDINYGFDVRRYKKDLSVVAIMDGEGTESRLLGQLVRCDGRFEVRLTSKSPESLWLAVYPDTKKRALAKVKCCFFPDYEWAKTPWYFLGGQTSTLYEVFDGHIRACSDVSLKESGEADGFNMKEYYPTGGSFYNSAIRELKIAKMTCVEELLAARDAGHVKTAIETILTQEENDALMA